MQMQKIKKTTTNTKKATDKKKDENENMLLEYMEDVDDKLFKECSYGKSFKSFIYEFDCENKEKVVKELKDINSFVKHHAQMEDDYCE